MLVIQQMGRLKETLVALVALERPIGWVFMRTTVAHKRILLFKAHLTLFTLERPLFRVRALVLPKIRRALEAFPACGASKRSFSDRLALMVQQLG